MVKCFGNVSVRGCAAFQVGEGKINVLAHAENKTPLSLQGVFLNKMITLQYHGYVT
jgi:hypothetical protein